MILNHIAFNKKNLISVFREANHLFKQCFKFISLELIAHRILIILECFLSVLSLFGLINLSEICLVYCFCFNSQLFDLFSKSSLSLFLFS